METRNISLKALKELKYIDSLDGEYKEQELFRWDNKYLVPNNKINEVNLEKKDLEELLELFYKNIHFLKNYKNSIKKQMEMTFKLKEFVKNG